MRAGLLAALALLLAAPAAAYADETITAIPRDRYERAEYTIDAGEKVNFTNRDIATHDVVGEGFKSRLTDPGQTAPVEGADKLGGGRYEFFCSLHSNMRGTLVVNGPAAPPPPPPGDQPPPPPAADTTPPGLIVRILRRVRAVIVRVTVDEAATVKIGTRTRSTTGPGRVTFRLPRRVRRVTIVATDTAGNRRTVTRRVPRRR
jgi:plastocyanin